MMIFDQIFAIVVGEEGGYTANPADPGNWTGNKVGAGTNKGTKYGIAASAHPDVDITSLTLEQAKQIYRNEYWAKVRGDDLPSGVALVVFDAAVNSGVDRASRWLQSSVGVEQDGIIGPATIAGVMRVGAAAAALEMCAQRLVFLAALATWSTFRVGWTRRVIGLAGVAETFGTPARGPVVTTVDPAVITAIEQAVHKGMTEKVVA